MSEGVEGFTRSLFAQRSIASPLRQPASFALARRDGSFTAVTETVT